MGVYLSEPETKKNTVIGSRGTTSFCCSEMQGWRKNMEDAAIHEVDMGDGNSLFAVFDGHGGPQVSKYVSQAFLQILKSNPNYQAKNYVQALDETFKKVDQILASEQGKEKLKQLRHGNELQKYHAQPNIANGTGCTANVVLITHDFYYIANAGDSRSALSKCGVAINLSEDHKPESPIEMKRIKKAGGVIQMGRVNGGLNLTRSFGDFEYKQNQSFDYREQMITCHPDIKEMARSEDDQFIIIGCDGIWEKYINSSQGLINQIKQDLSSKKDIKSVMEDLLDSLLGKDTNSGLGCDNMTAILVLLK